jgi:glycerol-3-phosphate dehydrogenase (NAD(P)+)
VKIAILGDGGWGTAIAILLRSKGYEVFLWGAFPDYVEFLNKKRKNLKFLPSVKIPEEITISSDLKKVVKDTTLIVLAIPSHVMREVVRQLKGCDISQSIILSVAKGIENKTLMRMSEVIAEEINPPRLAVLSGPSHAEEVARQVPTAVVVSSPDREVAIQTQNIFMAERFRVYTNTDIIGVELGGALKNVVAIAAGVSDGLGFGANTKAALLSRGIVEMIRLGVSLGARPGTFNGLSGIGDLIATCISPYSRNRQVGELIARGKKLNQILEEMEMVAEGIKTTRSIRDLALSLNVEMPISKGVYSILYEDKPPLSVVNDLMIRKAKPESGENLK